MPKIGFQVDGIQYELTGRQYVIQIDGQCISGIRGQYGMPGVSIIIGDTFMKNYYVHFDYEKRQMGIAPSNQDDELLSEDI